MSNISKVDSGYNTSRVLTMSVTYFQTDPANRNGWSDFHHLALERVSALPGVESAAFAWGVPLTGKSIGSMDRSYAYPASERKLKNVIGSHSLASREFTFRLGSR